MSTYISQKPAISKLILYSKTWEALDSSEMVVSIYQTTRHHIPEENHHNQRWEKLKSYEEFIVAVNVCNSLSTRQWHSITSKLRCIKCSLLYNFVYVSADACVRACEGGRARKTCLVSWIIWKDTYYPTFTNRPNSRGNDHYGVIIWP
jgi:hypothetical protein